MDIGEVYGIGFWITAVLTFIISWIYCIGTYGFLMGGAIGWIPSIILAAIIGAIWPLLLVGIVIIIIILIAA